MATPPVHFLMPQTVSHAVDTLLVTVPRCTISALLGFPPDDSGRDLHYAVQTVGRHNAELSGVVSLNGHIKRKPERTCLFVRPSACCIFPSFSIAFDHTCNILRRYKICVSFPWSILISPRTTLQMIRFKCKELTGEVLFF